ncbi:MAG: DUF378 domain-containing protein [Gammaproteobacteria bacterium]|nr:DUF378 domain-containing protein [Gammaproteobacteria bacterium]MCW5583040.1 DUF378 domain-containing protein [Gammaproteobacteria bacterium]
MLKELDFYSQIAFILVLIGGILWGLVGLFNLYLITAILGDLLGRLIYIIIGLGAGWLCYHVYLEKMKKA